MTHSEEILLGCMRGFSLAAYEPNESNLTDARSLKYQRVKVTALLILDYTILKRRMYHVHVIKTGCWWAAGFTAHQK